MSTYTTQIYKVKYKPIESANSIQQIILLDEQGNELGWKVATGINNTGEYYLYIPMTMQVPYSFALQFGFIREDAKYKEFIKVKPKMFTFLKPSFVSEGWAIQLSDLEASKPDVYPLYTDLNEVLNIKREEEEIEQARGVGGQGLTFPIHFPKYDIEQYSNFPHVIQSNTNVSITKKLNGSNEAFVVYTQNNKYVYRVLSRNYAYDENNIANKGLHFVEMSKKLNMQERLITYAKDHNLDNIAIRGELCGPKLQNNYYKLAEINFYCFDVIINSQYLNVIEKFSFCEFFGVKQVPELYHGPLTKFYLSQDQFTYRDFLEGTFSKEGSTTEGIIIESVEEQQVEFKRGDFGRCKLKVINTQYLSEK